ncbi:MAG: transcription termination/antitermination protein NusA [Candidatus Dadabacteria bacterium]|nr:transcription termination/antitermination protein NusA [Candidatus Dadabacteria bacterium]MYC39906.1 transcription termination/antitermination protein NusA [Candidatus Dadabacteria bacterium]
MITELTRVIDSVGKDKGIDRERIISAVEEAVLSAAEKLLKSKNQDKELDVYYNPEEGEVELFEYKEVVETVTEPELEISLAEASELDPETELGDMIGVKISPEYTRIAIHNAKQKVLQKLKEAEGKVIYEEFIGRKGTIIGGIVRRIDRRHIIVDLGRVEAVLPPEQQVPREYYKMKERIRAVLLDIRESPRGEPRLILSRAHVSFVTRLFESEVPEIAENIVEIKAISRDPGGRTKIAVASNDSDVDAVGACVGMRGSRVQSIIQELRGEKVDIVPWSEDPARYVCNALSPAVVNKVVIDENSRSMEVIVDDDQLSLAIGRKGQNVRLASQLTEWKIDIKTESRVKQEQQEVLSLLTSLPSVSEVTASLLYNDGFYSLEHIAFCEPDVLMKVGSLSEEEVSTLQKAARVALMEKLEEMPVESEAEAASDGEEVQPSSPSDEEVGDLGKGD